MIKAYNVLTEFVKDLGDDFLIDAITESGVTFYYIPRVDLKLGLAIAPMFGIKKGQVGLMVTRNSSFPYEDSCYRLEDPEFLNKIKSRICYWISNENSSPIPKDVINKLLSHVQ